MEIVWYAKRVYLAKEPKHLIKLDGSETKTLTYPPPLHKQCKLHQTRIAQLEMSVSLLQPVDNEILPLPAFRPNYTGLENSPLVHFVYMSSDELSYCIVCCCRFVVYFAARTSDGLLCVGAATSNSVTGPYEDIGAPLVLNKSEVKWAHIYICTSDTIVCIH